MLFQLATRRQGTLAGERFFVPADMGWREICPPPFSAGAAAQQLRQARLYRVHAKCKWAEMPHLNDKRLSGRTRALDRVCADISRAVPECGQNSEVGLSL